MQRPSTPVSQQWPGRNRSVAAVLAAVTGLASILLFGSSSAQTAFRTSCFGKPATVVPAGSDVLRGTSGDDVIVGTRGSDRVLGRGGNDLICGRGGDDFIEAGAGHDKIRGGAGIDDIWGGAGNDRIWSGKGPAEGLHGGQGKDRLFGGAGTEDYLFGGPGDDLLGGGAGHDFAMYVDSPRGIHADLLSGLATGEGEDRFVGLEALVGSGFDDVLYGDDEMNSLAGGPGSDELHGRHGDDRLRSGWGGDDLLEGGGGVDTANYYLGWYPVELDLAEGQAVASGVDTLVGITDVVGSKFDDRLTGDAQDNLIHASRGNDIIDGGAGTDTAAFFDSFELDIDLEAGTAAEERGADRLENFENVIGSSFADTIMGDNGSNHIWGDRGDDTLTGAGGDDVLLGAGGSDSADGGSGSDTCDAEIEVDCETDPTAASEAYRGSADDPVPPETLLWDEGATRECTPAGSRLAFVRDLGNGVGNEIFTVRPDGTGLKRLTRNSVDEWGPSWSPDGTKIAFSSTRHGNSEIYVMHRSGSDVVRLTEHPASDGVPTWSPDGTRIAFSSSREDPKDSLHDIFVMDADGGNVRKLVGKPEDSEIDPSWSRHGLIAFHRNDLIFTANEDGSGEKRLTTRRRMLATNPSWSRDGRMIAFQAQTSEEDGMDVFVMRSDGSNKRVLIGGKGDQQGPTWSPSGKRLGFADRWRVAVVSLRGGRSRVLFDHDFADYTVDWGRAVRC